VHFCNSNTSHGSSLFTCCSSSCQPPSPHGESDGWTIDSTFLFSDDIALRESPVGNTLMCLIACGSLPSPQKKKKHGTNLHTWCPVTCHIPSLVQVQIFHKYHSNIRCYIGLCYLLHSFTLVWLKNDLTFQSLYYIGGTLLVWSVFMPFCCFFSRIINIVTCQRIARQRLDEYSAIRVRNNRTNVYSSLLGNSQHGNGLAR
jgi:hypothetical protein